MLAIAPATDPSVAVWHECHTDTALKRTTVYLDENDLRDLKIAAARRGVSEAEIIREGVRHALRGSSPRSTRMPRSTRAPVT